MLLAQTHIFAVLLTEKRVIGLALKLTTTMMLVPRRTRSLQPQSSTARSRARAYRTNGTKEAISPRRGMKSVAIKRLSGPFASRAASRLQQDGLCASSGA
jgi:hypothetical protein